MTIRYRSSTSDDDPIITRHFYQMWMDNNVAPEHIRSDWESVILEFIHQARSQWSYQCFIAETTKPDNSTGDIVGSAGGQIFQGLYPLVMQPDYHKDGYIWGVYVEADYRKQGIGAQLTQRVVGYLKSQGFTMLRETIFHLMRTFFLIPFRILQN